MKCYACGQEPSVGVRDLEMVRSIRETMKFYCRDCYEKGRWK
jgi:hypothetical protein